MDADGLPLVGPGIDYNKVEAISQKRTIAFINHFITHTSRFLNHFANVCEDKLERLTGRLQQLEISLSVLEAKLSSIPGLESVTVSDTSTVLTSEALPTINASYSNPEISATVITAPSSNHEEIPLPAEDIKPHNPVAQDPRYLKYFKMLQYGVPPPVIKGKMEIDGLNPDLLDTPDVSTPDEGVSKAKQDSVSGSDSDPSFSD